MQNVIVKMGKKHIDVKCKNDTVKFTENGHAVVDLSEILSELSQVKGMIISESK